jgi:hypothetical protein
MQKNIEQFLSNYMEEVFANSLKLRTVLLNQLPNITEQLDVPAKMIGYCYGQEYVDLICVIIPSKKGLKLGFNRGVELPDPEKLLQGKGKISRYVVIENEKQIQSAALKKLIKEALKLYQEKMK